MEESNRLAVEIIFEDKEIVILNKPSGLLAIEDGYQPLLPNLRSMLKQHYGQIWAVHRLDKDTSGIILFAKNAASHKYLNSLFSDRKISKSYKAIVCGNPMWKEKKIDLPLKVNGDRRHRTILDDRLGKKSITTLLVTEQLLGYARMDVSPQTGITHQIRAHLALLGFPIAGDSLYFRGCPLHSMIQKKKMYLHAFSLEIPSEDRSGTMRFSAQIPDYFFSFP